MTTPTTRWQGRNFSVTYPQCPLERQSVLDFFQDKYGDKLTKWVVARERHEDGNFHLHIYLGFSKKVDIKNPRLWDITDDNTTYHPNIQTTKDVTAWVTYCQKEDSECISNVTIKRSYGDILSTADSQETFLQAVKEAYPRDYVLQNDRVRDFAEREFKKRNITEYVPKYSREDFPNEPLELTNWVNENIGVSV